MQDDKSTKPDLRRRQQLKRILRGFSVLALLTIGAVLVDYSFRQAEPPVYRFKVPRLEFDQPVILTQGNFMVIVARYSDSRLESLSPKGRVSGISASFRGEFLPVDQGGYFVVQAYGTYLGCPLEIDLDGFYETCSNARYDFLGRAITSGQYSNLDPVDYHFNRDYSLLYIE
jgi:hypothetical protein